VNLAFYDGDWDTPQADGPPRWQMPFGGADPFAYLYEQDYVQKIEKWKPGKIGSPGEVPRYFLVSETDIESAGNGIARWTRTYCGRRLERRGDWPI